MSTLGTPRYARLSTLDQRGPGQQTDALRYFRTQLARRESNPVDIVCIGHSLVEGEGATAQAKRGTDRLKDALRARFQPPGITGGYGFMATADNVNSWSIGTTFSGGTFSSAYGPGKQGYFVNVSGAKVTLPATTCTAVDVLYIQGGGGTFTTTVGGVANGDSKATTPGPTQMMKYRVPGISGAAAPHSVEVGFVSGNSIIVGFMIYNGDESAGIRMWTDAQGGLTSAQLVDNANQNIADLTTIAPCLVTVTCLANDFKTGVATATSRTNLASIVGNIRAKAPNASIVFAIEHALGSTGATIPWSDYVQQYYDVATADGNIAVFDFWQRIGTATPPTAPGMIAGDNQHYTDAGYLMWAEALASFVSP